MERRNLSTEELSLNSFPTRRSSDLDRNLGYALEIGDITKYEIPKTLSEIGVKSAPQSFIYLK